MKRLTHIGADGRAQMVDVSAKPLSARIAVASGRISLQKQTADLIRKNKIAKGNVIATARIAGIQAAKQKRGRLAPAPPLEMTDRSFGASPVLLPI